MAEKIVMIALSPTMEEGIIAKWNKKEGESVASGDVLCEVETDKATMDYEAMAEGMLLKIVVPEGGKAAIGDMIAIVGEEGEAVDSLLEEDKREAKADPTQEKPTSEPSTLEKEPEKTSKGRVLSSPLARRLAEINHLDIRSIEGSGPAGRVIKRDIEEALQYQQPAVEPALQDNRAALSSDRSIPVSAKRKVIASRLSQSKYSAPHYYLKVVVQMDEILSARKALNASRKEKVSMNAFFVKFVAEALKRHPMVNASWEDAQIILHGTADIGLAVAQPDGLITPIVRDCGSKGILSIDDELRVLIQKAQNNQLKPDEYTGATFTISNLGSYGIREFTAIINPPGAAILAIGEIRREPVVDEHDEISIHSTMAMTLSCDHRVIDGAVGAAFLKDLKEMLENPVRALL